MIDICEMQMLQVKELAFLLGEKTEKIMDRFKFLGSRAKRMHLNNECPEEIEAVHLEMADLFYGMSAVEALVRKQYPEYNELFDALTTLREIHKGQQFSCACRESELERYQSPDMFMLEDKYEPVRMLRLYGSALSY